jgi:hypothetical protein
VWRPDALLAPDVQALTSPSLLRKSPINKLVLPPFQIISQSILTLTKIIEKIIKIYNIKYVYYKNIINEESNDT